MGMLDMLEGFLGLSDAEKNTVAAAAPTIDKWVTGLNGHWDTLQNAVGWLTNSRALAERLIQDGKVLAPIVHTALTGGGGMFETGRAMDAVRDVKEVLAANPKFVNAMKIDYAKLAPLLNQIQNDLKKPEIRQALGLVQSKMAARNLDHGALLTAVVQEAGKQSKETSK